MSIIPHTGATLGDLARIEGRAELVNGEIVVMSPTGDNPATAAGQIFISLSAYAKKNRTGRAYTDNVAFAVNLPHRKSLSPDTSFYTGPRGGMKFLPQAPVFAVEVRSENSYGAKAEAELAAKRADYFAAGTIAVWDVDLVGENVVSLYLSFDPTKPIRFKRGEAANAEPAVPGWTMPVDELFDE